MSPHITYTAKEIAKNVDNLGLLASQRSATVAAVCFTLAIKHSKRHDDLLERSKLTEKIQITLKVEFRSLEVAYQAVKSR